VLAITIKDAALMIVRFIIISKKCGGIAVEETIEHIFKLATAPPLLRGDLVRIDLGHDLALL
jgi:hypothetical protein